MHIHERFHFTSLEELILAIENRGLHIPVSDDINVLGDPVTISEKVIPNRIAVQPMEGCDGTVEGNPGELTFRRYKRFATGGAGLLWFEATAVVKEGRANPRQLLLSGENINEFKSLLKDSLREAREKYGSDRKPYTVLQLTHSGRYSRPESERRPLIAVKNPHLEGQLINYTDGSRTAPAFHILTDDELEELEERFADAAAMAEEIGFDAVDIKSCHGYLNAELLSARKREGRYGGSFENRTRFLLNTVDRINLRTTDTFAVAIRLNAYDSIPWPYGWGVDSDNHRNYDLAEPIQLIKLLRKRGVQLINITTGIPHYNPHITRPYDYGPYIPPEHPLSGVERMLKISRDIQQAVPDMVVVSTGFSWLREYGANIAAGGIKEGWFSIAGFGRQSLAYPDFPEDIITRGRMERKKCCITCGKCSEIMQLNGKAGCVIRDAKTYLPIYRQVINGKSSPRGIHTADHI